MKLLSRGEELIMLAIWRLKDEAYCLEIMEQAEKDTGKNWTLGGIYALLNRLEKNGYIQSKFGPPTPERGGKSKRYYEVTPKGLAELKEIKKIELNIWRGLSDSITDTVK